MPSGEMDHIALNLARVHPDTNEGWSTALRPVFPLNEHLQPALVVLLGAVGCVLLIACLNVATLLSVRAAVRQRELAVRVAVGASRGRVIRQLLTESAVLATLGAVGGVGVAFVSLRALATVVPPVQITRALTLFIDARALGVTAAVAGLTALVFGLAPALRASRHPGLQVGPRTSWRVVVGRVLLPAQVAMSVVLLAGAALLIRSLWNLQQVDPGFRAAGVVTLQLWLPEERYPGPADISGFLTDVLQRLGQHPEITAAGLTNTRPFLGWDIGVTVDVPGYVPRPNEVLNVSARIVSPDTFAALGTRLIRGRVLEDRDGWDQAGAVLVNEAMVRRFWPEDDPVGSSLEARFLASAPAAPWWPFEATDAYTVVGVVEDVKERRLGEDVAPMVYLLLPANAHALHAPADTNDRSGGEDHVRSRPRDTRN